MKKALIQFLEIMHRHPVAFFVVGLATGLIAGWLGAQREDWRMLRWLTVLWFAAWAGLLFLDRKKLLPLLLVGALAVSPAAMAQQAEPEPFQPAAPGPVVLGVGLGLLIGTGYVAVRFIRACAKIRGTPTNAPPTGTNNYA